jgi:hypothetical protein
MRIMLAGDLIDWSRYRLLTPWEELIGRIMRSQRPYDLTRLFIDVRVINRRHHEARFNELILLLSKTYLGLPGPSGCLGFAPRPSRPRVPE